ncbi:hypothetical protein P4O66_010725 [Electrophorus voltai]|uniref:Receptor expression-enhancing protein n=1 Tax=Electrophorus voltai TaxID=2609070 RepID=A0AAD9DV07_9TELE|nr:hypothetical protein P4O66_010725 [Electrophorus voltai]
MVSWIISRTVVLVFGNLYPAYYSYKAVKTKNVKEYVRWMMYWIVFSLYTVVETISDLTIAWFPLYYEIKIAFVIWLLSPYTRGASLIYRKILHPLLTSKEREIDDYIIQAKERSYETMLHFGKQGLSIAATAAVSAAVKARSRGLSRPVPPRLPSEQEVAFRFAPRSGRLGTAPGQGQGAITEKLRSFSMADLSQIPQDDASAALFPAYSGANPARRAAGASQPDGAGKRRHLLSERSPASALSRSHGV